MPAPTAGFLGSVKVGPSASPTNLMSDVTDISEPWAAAQYDISSMNATNNGWQQYIPGLKGGKVTIKANYVPGDTNGQQVMTNAWVNGTLLYFITSKNGTNTATYSGYISDVQIHAPVNNKSDVTYVIMVSSSVTFA